MIFIFDNMCNSLNIVMFMINMKNKKSKKLEEKTKKELEHEQMLEQAHQLELQKNYESDEKFDESAE